MERQSQSNRSMKLKVIHLFIALDPNSSIMFPHILAAITIYLKDLFILTFQ